MANHDIANQFNQQLRKVEVSDSVHADFINPIFSQLINNDAFIKALVDSNDAFIKALIDAKMHQSTGHKHTGTTGDAPQIGTTGIADNAITPAKLHADLINSLTGLANQFLSVGALIDAKMHQSAGHKHTGNTGDAPQIGTTGIADSAITPAKLGTLNRINLGGGFEVYYNATSVSLDFEVPVNGIPFIHTDAVLAGVSEHME